MEVPVKNAIIAGAGGAIGEALIKEYLQDEKTTWNVVALTRSPLGEYQFRIKSALNLCQNSLTERLHVMNVDVTRESEVERMVSSLPPSFDKLHLFVNAVGYLSDEESRPEKSLRDFRPEFFHKNIDINTLPSILCAKHLTKAFRHPEQSAFVSLSAKLGSMGDNNLGGWYSYRISKAALNMAIRNIHLEYRHRRTNCSVAAVHPGTTHSRLTQGFTDNLSYQVKDPEETAVILKSLFDNLDTDLHGGKLLNFDGQEIPW